ncbi:hypothetical protein FKM82_017313 [Ascaphus truei]
MVCTLFTNSSCGIVLVLHCDSLSHCNARLSPFTNMDIGIHIATPVHCCWEHLACTLITFEVCNIYRGVPRVTSSLYQQCLHST